VDALFAVEVGRVALFAGHERLGGADLDAGAFRARCAELRIGKGHMVGKAAHGLHLAALEEDVLVRHEERAVKGNGWPACQIHERVVQRLLGLRALFGDLLELFRRDFRTADAGHRLDDLRGRQ